MISGKQFFDYCKQMGYQMLAIEDKHVQELESLVYHKDIQDHMTHLIVLCWHRQKRRICVL